MVIFDQLKKNDVYLKVITLAVLTGMLVLVGGLYYVQILSARHYAENQISQSFRTVRIPALRGKILDRNGNALADNRPSYTLGLYLEELRDLFKAEWRRSRPKTRVSRKERYQLEAQARYRVASNIAHRLSLVLQTNIHLDFDQFNKHYNTQLALPLPLIENMNRRMIARMQEQPLDLPGIDLSPLPYRYYPWGETAAHLIGYLTRDDSSAKDEEAFFNFRLPDYRGRVGIEKTFDESLRGRAGAKSVLVNSMGYRQSETVWTPAQPGKDLHLTIDLVIQRAAEEALADALPDTRGAAVVLDPNNGELLALASAPAFDPNLFIPSITRSNYQRLLDPKRRPQINRAVQENYAPGSIFKIIVGLACLESGLDPKIALYNPGYIRLGRRYINDTAKPGHYDFRRAFLKSSNTYFITNGLRTGLNGILGMGRQLMLGEVTGLPTAQEVPGFFPDDATIRKGWSIGDTANLCIGQGLIDVTPMQMAIMTAAIANNGHVLKPRLVDRIEPASPYDDDTVQSFPGRVVRGRLKVSPHSLKVLQEAMLADVEDPEGTGRAAGLPGLQVCGKTGTAQVEKFTPEGRRYVDQNTWFVSYAPFEKPRYVVVVMVESGASGGGTCAPVARKIYRALLDRENTRPPDLSQTYPSTTP